MPVHVTFFGDFCFNCGLKINVIRGSFKIFYSTLTLVHCKIRLIIENTHRLQLLWLGQTSRGPLMTQGGQGHVFLTLHQPCHVAWGPLTRSIGGDSDRGHANSHLHSPRQEGSEENTPALGPGGVLYSHRHKATETLELSSAPQPGSNPRGCSRVAAASFHPHSRPLTSLPTLLEGWPRPGHRTVLTSCYMTI